MVNSWSSSSPSFFMRSKCFFFRHPPQSCPQRAILHRILASSKTASNEIQWLHNNGEEFSPTNFSVALYYTCNNDNLSFFSSFSLNVVAAVMHWLTHCTSLNLSLWLSSSSVTWLAGSLATSQAIDPGCAVVYNVHSEIVQVDTAATASTVARQLLHVRVVGTDVYTV